MPGIAEANQPRVGVVGAANTNVHAVDQQKAMRELVLGKDVFFNETIKTDENGNAQIIFMDKSTLSVGPNSELTIDRFVYDPNSSAGELTINSTKGAFRFIGGALSKKKPVKFKTPVSTIGIRGGIGMVNVAPGGETDATFVYGEEMTMENQAGDSVSITDQGFGSSITSPDAPPTPPAPVPATQMAGMITNFISKPGQTGGTPNPPSEEAVSGKLSADSDEGPVDSGNEGGDEGGQQESRNDAESNDEGEGESADSSDGESNDGGNNETASENEGGDEAGNDGSSETASNETDAPANDNEAGEGGDAPRAEGQEGEGPRGGPVNSAEGPGGSSEGGPVNTAEGPGGDGFGDGPAPEGRAPEGPANAAFNPDAPDAAVASDKNDTNRDNQANQTVNQRVNFCAENPNAPGCGAVTKLADRCAENPGSPECRRASNSDDESDDEGRGFFDRLANTLGGRDDEGNGNNDDTASLLDDGPNDDLINDDDTTEQTDNNTDSSGDDNNGGTTSGGTTSGGTTTTLASGLSGSHAGMNAAPDHDGTLTDGRPSEVDSYGSVSNVNVISALSTTTITGDIINENGADDPSFTVRHANTASTGLIDIESAFVGGSSYDTTNSHLFLSPNKHMYALSLNDGSAGQYNLVFGRSMTTSDLPSSNGLVSHYKFLPSAYSHASLAYPVGMFDYGIESSVASQMGYNGVSEGDFLIDWSKQQFFTAGLPSAIEADTSLTVAFGDVKNVTDANNALEGLIFTFGTDDHATQDGANDLMLRFDIGHLRTESGLFFGSGSDVDGAMLEGVQSSAFASATFDNNAFLSGVDERDSQPIVLDTSVHSNGTSNQILTETSSQKGYAAGFMIENARDVSSGGGPSYHEFYNTDFNNVMVDRTSDGSDGLGAKIEITDGTVTAKAYFGAANAGGGEAVDLGGSRFAAQQNAAWYGSPSSSGALPAVSNGADQGIIVGSHAFQGAEYDCTSCDYVEWGMWAADFKDPTFNNEHNVAYLIPFVTGEITPNAAFDNIFTTDGIASGSYTGVSIGTLMDDSNPSNILIEHATGNFDATVNFQNRTIDSISGDLTGSMGKTLSYSAPSAINMQGGSASFIGTGALDQGNVTGDIHGAFYGPDAQNIGGNFVASDSGQNLHGAGIFIGSTPDTTP